MPTFRKITVSVKVNASISKSWNAFTSASSIVKWNFASDDWCCPKASNDLRQGGAFNYRMESKDGKYGFDFCGTYTMVIPENRIDFALGDGREVSVIFQAAGNQTEVIETFDAETENSLELQKNGWQAILDNFRKHAESIK
jgi:uncharacterized protein YndB with AHSA1/START domain